MKTANLMLIQIAVLAAVSGCATDGQPSQPGQPLSAALRAKEPAAMESALARARTDLACPAATAKLVSAQRLKPNFPGPQVQSPDRVEFNVDAAGCGKRLALRVICADDATACYVGQSAAR